MTVKKRTFFLHFYVKTMVDSYSQNKTFQFTISWNTKTFCNMNYIFTFSTKAMADSNSQNKIFSINFSNYFKNIILYIAI